MRKLLIFLLMIIMVFVSACSKEISDNLVLIKGGDFANTKSNYYGKNIKLSDFLYRVSMKLLKRSGVKSWEAIHHNLKVIIYL